jgi:hypothetical protein
MGGAGAQLEPHESVTGLLKFFKQATPEHSAGFFRCAPLRTPAPPSAC